MSELPAFTQDTALIARALAARQCVTADPTKALAQFLEHYEENPTAFTPTFPGVPETLERLQAIGLTLAICTNKPTRLTHMILERLGINRFFVRVIAGDTLPFRKPDPRALIEVLNVFGTPPAAAIMVGDSEVDAATAHAANVPFVLMTYGYHRGPIDGISSIATLDHFAEPARLGQRNRQPSGHLGHVAGTACQTDDGAGRLYCHALQLHCRPVVPEAVFGVRFQVDKTVQRIVLHRRFKRAVGAGEQPAHPGIVSDTACSVEVIALVGQFPRHISPQCIDPQC